MQERSLRRPIPIHWPLLRLKVWIKRLFLLLLGPCARVKQTHIRDLDVVQGVAEEKRHWQRGLGQGDTQQNVFFHVETGQVCQVLGVLKLSVLEVKLYLGCIIAKILPDLVLDIQNV